LRLLSHNLRPPGLDAYGLNAALEGLCQDFAHHSSVVITYSGVDVPSLSALAELSLYRFAQEGLTNAMKHATATHIEVNLVPEPDVVILTVTDNGRGFVPPDLDENIPSEGVGLVGMIERLEMVDGSLEIESTLGAGSRLTAVVPLTKETS